MFCWVFSPYQEDFEKAFGLDPSNAEVRQQLQQLRDLQREEKRQTAQAQQATKGFRNIFAKPLYDTEAPKPILRETEGKEWNVAGSFCWYFQI